MEQEAKIAEAIGYAHAPSQRRQAFATSQEQAIKIAIGECIRDRVALDSDEAFARIQQARISNMREHQAQDRVAHNQALTIELEQRRSALHDQLRVIEESLQRLRAMPA